VVAQNMKLARDSLRSPRAAAIAGIAFALLLGTALVLVRIGFLPTRVTLPPGSTTGFARVPW
jgi:hypothetical protein